MSTLFIQCRTNFSIKNCAPHLRNDLYQNSATFFRQSKQTFFNTTSSTFVKKLKIHAVFQLRDSKFLTLVLSPIFFQIQTRPCPLCLAWSTLYRPIFLTTQMQIFNFNKKSNAIIMVRSHKTSTFACQLQKRNYSLSLKSLTYTSLCLSGVPYFFRQADYCLLFSG